MSLSEKARALGNQPAYPIHASGVATLPEDMRVSAANLGATGLTKREYFAAMALSGMSHFDCPDEQIAKHSVSAADALLEELVRS